MSTAKPEKSPEQLDEEELRDVEGKIKEVMALMSAGHTRESGDERLKTARARQEEHHGNRQSVYHITTQGHIPTTMHTHTSMELAEALKTRIQLGGYARNLEDSLRRLSERHVAVLERILARSRY